MTIRSSLEIALERTKDVQADPDTLKASGFATAGKKLVSQFLGDPEFSLAKKVREHDGKERGWVSDGVFDALASNLALPADEYGLKRNRRAMEGFAAILRDQRRLRIMGQQVEQFFAEYFQERQQLKQNVDRQYGPAPAAEGRGARPPYRQPGAHRSGHRSRVRTAPAAADGAVRGPLRHRVAAGQAGNSAACSDAGKPDQSAACC